MSDPTRCDDTLQTDLLHPVAVACWQGWLAVHTWGACSFLISISRPGGPAPSSVTSVHIPKTAHRAPYGQSMHGQSIWAVFACMHASIHPAQGIRLPLRHPSMYGQSLHPCIWLPLLLLRPNDGVSSGSSGVSSQKDVTVACEVRTSDPNQRNDVVAVLQYDVAICKGVVFTEHGHG